MARRRGGEGKKDKRKKGKKGEKNARKDCRNHPSSAEGSGKKGRIVSHFHHDYFISLKELKKGEGKVAKRRKELGAPPAETISPQHPRGEKRGENEKGEKKREPCLTHRARRKDGEGTGGKKRRGKGNNDVFFIFFA